MTTLIVFLAVADGDPAIWGLFEGDVLARAGRQTQPFVFGAEDAPDKTIVVVPGGDVLMRSVRFPPQSLTQMSNSASFMLEDDLAVDPTEMHFAVGEPLVAGEERPVAAVSHAVMNNWQARITALGLKANAMVPDFMALPPAPACVVDAGAWIIVRNGLFGFAVEPALLGWLIDEAMEQAQSVRVVSQNPTALLGGALSPFRAVAKSEALSDAVRLQDAFTAASGAPLNLLQALYAPRRDWRAAAQTWRRSLTLTAATALAALALMVTDSLRLQRDAEAATARAEAVFRQALPSVTRVVNPRAQMNAALQDIKAKASNDFLRTSGILFAVISETPDSQIQTLRFDGKRGETTATLIVPAFDVIERIKTEVRTRGGVMSEGGARQDAGQVVADIIVRLP
jgi:general secretion pathway protein L